MNKGFSHIVKNEMMETAASLRASPVMGGASAWTAATNSKEREENMEVIMFLLTFSFLKAAECQEVLIRFL